MKYYIIVCYSLLVYWFYLIYQNTFVCEFGSAPFLYDAWLDRNNYYYIILVIILISILVALSAFRKEYYRFPLLLTYLVFDDCVAVTKWWKYALIIIGVTIVYDLYRCTKKKKNTTQKV